MEKQSSTSGPVASSSANEVGAGPMQDARRHLIDELLEERAVTLRRSPLLWRLLTRWCLRLFRYREAVAWSDRLAGLDGNDALDEFAGYLDLNVCVSGLEHVPRSGRLLIVANHPTGMVDAMALRAIVRPIRPDLYCFSNRDIIRLVPRTRDYIIPVEWLRWRRTREAMRETLQAADAAFRCEGAVIIFPAGGIARCSRSGLKELDWIDTTLKFMRRYDCPILPVHIRARNSLLYYLFDAIHPELRDLLRFREILGKRRQRFVVTIGALIGPETIGPDPAEETTVLQEYVLRGLPRGATWPVERRLPPKPRTPVGNSLTSALQTHLKA